MSNYIITIARQYGSGGRTIGQMLSEKLGIPFYDKDIIRMASEESGISEALFSHLDENLISKLPKLKNGSTILGDVLPPDSKNFTSDTNLFNYTAKVIKDLADKSSCVIIGKCSNYILKDDPRALRVYIHASDEVRLREALKKNGGSIQDVERFLLADDRRKENLCQRVAGHNWNDATAYDLCLNSTNMTYEDCVSVIEHRVSLMK